MTVAEYFKMSSSIIGCLFDTKENNNKYYMSVLLLIDQRLRCIGVKDFSTELNCNNSNPVFGRRHFKLFNCHVLWDTVVSWTV